MIVIRSDFSSAIAQHFNIFTPLPYLSSYTSVPVPSHLAFCAFVCAPQFWMLTMRRLPSTLLCTMSPWRRASPEITLWLASPAPTTTLASMQSLATSSQVRGLRWGGFCQCMCRVFVHLRMWVSVSNESVCKRNFKLNMHWFWVCVLLCLQVGTRMVNSALDSGMGLFGRWLVSTGRTRLLTRSLLKL